MKSRLELRPAHKPVQNYYAALSQRPLRVRGGLLSLSAWIPLAHRMGEGLRVRERERDGVRCRSDSADVSQKQQFLNAFCEKFFQGFCVKVADTHDVEVVAIHARANLDEESTQRVRSTHSQQP